MLRIACALSLALTGAANAAAPASDPAPPSFRDIENSYSGVEALNVGRSAILQAIPVGTSLQQAEAVLAAAGARCKPTHRDRQVFRCLYDEVTTVDEAVDDIRWETVLHTDGAVVSEISVNREVDRHGTA